MIKKMMINAEDPEESRVAIVTDGILEEFDIETAHKEQIKSNIYKGVVVKVEAGLQAAFVDYGGKRAGFLPLGEVHPTCYADPDLAKRGGRVRIHEVLKRNQELLVQIVKDEIGTKGAALSTYISLPGRYLVLMPGVDATRVSRKIEDESQRRKLKEIVAQLEPPAGMGVIIRTAGLERTKLVLPPHQTVSREAAHLLEIPTRGPDRGHFRGQDRAEIRGLDRHRAHRGDGLHRCQLRPFHARARHGGDRL
jgi:ribonuclease E